MCCLIVTYGRLVCDLRCGYLKIVAERFGGNRKSRTFAIPFEKRAAVKAESSLKN